MKATIADLGIGNLHSLAKALERCGAIVEVTPDPNRWLDASTLVLPGVGAFAAGMRPLEPVIDAIRSKLRSGAPMLGVCLGMQLLFERSDEDPVEGLGFVTGDVKRFPPTVGKVPHMGWSQLRFQPDPLFDGLASGSYAYFVHSYYPDPEEEVGIAETTYGVTFPSVIRKGHVVATQFHPEKSGDVGLRLLKNFLEFAEAFA